MHDIDPLVHQLYIRDLERQVQAARNPEARNPVAKRGVIAALLAAGIIILAIGITQIGVLTAILA